jgi:hypothetical protein
VLAVARIAGASSSAAATAALAAAIFMLTIYAWSACMSPARDFLSRPRVRRPRAAWPPGQRTDWC